ncbi:hypothetical protein T12_13267 [Trichinella patagoniensis]|uniref:Uncharacterized protein n=1 Tax=Trichinella patagoniensis TaxID=990121 RepID=A0A0V0Z4X5_9BILA|nr:hypothetical protein T12_13267 [Trichinella patagoniensis]
MPSGKRETERKVNAPVNTGPSPNSDERINNPTEGAGKGGSPAAAAWGLATSELGSHERRTSDTLGTNLPRPPSAGASSNAGALSPGFLPRLNGPPLVGCGWSSGFPGCSASE